MTIAGPMRSLIALIVILLALPGVAIAQEGATDAPPSAGASVGGPVTGYAPVNGLEMYYEIHGSGSPLVLLHGGLVGIDLSFGQVIPILVEQGRQVIAIEQQGHGHTGDIDRPLSYGQMAEDTAALLRHLGIGPADIFGYSMGGTTALELAMRHPDLVRKLIVVSAPFSPDGMYPEVLADIELMTADMFTGSGLPESYAAVAPDPDGWSELVEKVKQLERDFTAIAPEAIEAISAPMLIVIGDSDAIRPEHAIELFRLLGGGVSGDNVGMPERAQLAVLPGLSHVGVAMAVPTWLVPTITPFLDAPMPDGG